ncbi:DUF7573 domain-containing protein [Halovivax gelatinilyticus]|uniref:DUF7573 domain-containing protein n=1 Tax=Halovivax gelatinilyticus TaxID=2961597 RepID=UPI0020CA5546|nr:hypothetical protein [Halovivax gelatinilyticus]
MKRATLDDFAASSGADGSEDRQTAAETDGPAVTLAVGSDRPCATCSADATRLWRTDDGFVCPDCVEW